jgi:hypothetical protein
MPKAIKGFQFSPDSYLQNELKVLLFMRIHRIKLNQRRVKADMESDRPWIDWFVVM